MSQVDFVAAVFQKRLVDPLDRRQWEAKGMKFPNGIEVGPVVAEVNQARWVVNCPFCQAGGEMVDPADPRFFCLSCFNKENGSQWITVQFPSDRAEIEALIDTRLDDDWKNWHGESVQQLLEQNEVGFHHSWTAPRTWVTGEIVSAANMNTHVRDEFLETAVAKASAAGQVPYATAANALAMLTAVAYRMPRFNSAATAIEAIAGLNLAQAPLFASAAVINMVGSVYTAIVSQSITVHGGIVILLGWAQILEAKTATVATIDHKFAVYRDANFISLSSPQPLSRTDATASAWRFPVPVFAMETVAAGTYSYNIRGQYIAGATSGTPTADGAILVLELAP